jgi:hypothetical protein
MLFDKMNVKKISWSLIYGGFLMAKYVVLSTVFLLSTSTIQVVLFIINDDEKVLVTHNEYGAYCELGLPYDYFFFTGDKTYSLHGFSFPHFVLDLIIFFVGVVLLDFLWRKIIHELRLKRKE